MYINCVRRKHRKAKEDIRGRGNCRGNWPLVTEKTRVICALLLQAERLSAAEMLSTTTEEAAATNGHHFSLSRGSWG